LALFMQEYRPPFMLFAAGAGEGSSFMPFPPGTIIDAYIGGKFDISNFYVMGDVGGVLVILAGGIPNFFPIRLGGGWHFSEHGFLELNTVAIAQDILGSIGRIYYVEVGYEF